MVIGLDSDSDEFDSEACSHAYSWGCVGIPSPLLAISDTVPWIIIKAISTFLSFTVFRIAFCPLYLTFYLFLIGS
ncbi:hypothetical protein B0H17DRAFT_1104491 [Mycena rosella]|uniref:Uncharacterized protein n=1 Tax=Mycena rosella TaxID=1033263 RepID=A0AAD7FTZ8_MYCRO|nr:hypothetical protein B0H17DRAFT_1104491 [Mycena rosella]